MATIIAPKLTYRDLIEMPNDGKRYELVAGEVYVTPSPNRKHQEALLNLAVALRDLIKRRGLGKLYVAPFDVVLDESNVLQPDLIFVRKERLSIITAANVSGAPDIAIEVLSPGTARFDRETKLQLYARAGVPELWYVEPEAEMIEVLNLTPERGYMLTLRASGEQRVTSAILEGLSLTAREVFA